MLTYSAGELQRKLGEIQDKALRQPVSITRHGRARLVIMAVEEYERLKRRDRVVLRAGELSDADLEAIATADVPAEFAHLDAELSEG
jgi:prevent-host-death family protein